LTGLYNPDILPIVSGTKSFVNPEWQEGTSPVMERRCDPRVPVSYPVYYQGDSYPSARVASILDLSVGGVRIETLQALTVGDVLDMTIMVRSKLINCKGAVMHVVGWRGESLEAGIRFLGLLKQDRLYLGGFISYAMARQLVGIPLKGLIIGIALGLLLWILIVYPILLRK